MLCNSGNSSHHPQALFGQNVLKLGQSVLVGAVAVDADSNGLGGTGDALQALGGKIRHTAAEGGDRHQTDITLGGLQHGLVHQVDLYPLAVQSAGQNIRNAVNAPGGAESNAVICHVMASIE